MVMIATTFFFLTQPSVGQSAFSSCRRRVYCLSFAVLTLAERSRVKLRCTVHDASLAANSTLVQPRQLPYEHETDACSMYRDKRRKSYIYSSRCDSGLEALDCKNTRI